MAEESSIFTGSKTVLCLPNSTSNPWSWTRGGEVSVILGATPQFPISWAGLLIVRNFAPPTTILTPALITVPFALWSGNAATCRSIYVVKTESGHAWKRGLYRGLEVELEE